MACTINWALYENRDRNIITRSLKNARSPIPSSKVKTGICGPHHDVRRHVSGEKRKARVLTKTQQIIMDFGVLDYVKLEHLGRWHGPWRPMPSTKMFKFRVDKVGCAHWHTNAFQGCYSDDIKIRFVCVV
jgi:hypothetical protein